MVIELDRTYSFTVEEFSFGSLNKDALISIFKDGRVASHFIERQLVSWFPELTHVVGCKSYDHVKDEKQYEAKNFTERGCRFAPSSMIGKGRSFNKKEFMRKAAELTYIITDITQFPSILVRFVDGKQLANKYPNATITKIKRKEFFDL